MTKPTKKLPIIIGLAILTLTYVVNIFLNSKLYISFADQPYELLLCHIVLEPVFWILPVIFLLIWQKKTQPRVLSVPALILVGIAPSLKLVFSLFAAILSDLGGPEWLVMLIFTLFAIFMHPLVYMLIQTVFITILWFGFFFRGED